MRSPARTSAPLASTEAVSSEMGILLQSDHRTTPSRCRTCRTTHTRWAATSHRPCAFARINQIPAIIRQPLLVVAKKPSAAGAAPTCVFPFDFRRKPVSRPCQIIIRQDHVRADLIEGGIAHLAFRETLLLTEPAAVTYGIIPADFIGRTSGLGRFPAQALGIETQKLLYRYFVTAEGERHGDGRGMQRFDGITTRFGFG